MEVLVLENLNLFLAEVIFSKNCVSEIFILFLGGCPNFFIILLAPQLIVTLTH